MKKTVLTAVALMLVVVMLSLINISAAPVNEIAAVEENNAQVITVAKSKRLDSAKVLESRFLNMLNHNFAYNEALDTEEGVVNSAVISLLSYSEDGYIAENVVSDFIFDMYGVEIADYSAINPEFDYKKGYVFVLPMGYSTYKHSVISAKVNEDGSYTVITQVEISSHDSGAGFEECETLFVPNAKSQFGFNIIYSNIGAKAAAI